MAGLSIDSNEEFERNFLRKPKPIRLELFNLLHRVVTSDTPNHLEFVHRLNENEESYFFSTADGQSFITFELQFFGKLLFVACHCK
ncbi:MAG: hypothetical protein WD154_02840 [Nitrosopumilaceae archaeon]